MSSLRGNSVSGKRPFDGQILLRGLDNHVKLTAGDEYAVYARIMDVVQVNLANKQSHPFVASKANVYYQAAGNVKVKPLMLDLPSSKNAGYGISDGGWNSITYKQYKWY